MGSEEADLLKKCIKGSRLMAWMNHQAALLVRGHENPRGEGGSLMKRV